MKRIKYILILTILLIIALPVIAVKAADYNVGDYATLKEIVSNDETNKTIVLTEDIVVADDPGLTIKSGQELILDLNGHILSMESNITKASYLIKNNGNLTIKDSTDTNKNGTGNGRITYLSTVSSEAYAYACNTISNYGTLILESGLVENNTPNAHADYCVDNYSNNSLIRINGGKLYSLESWGIRMFVNSNTSGNDLEINGGEIEGGVWLQVPSSKLNPKANVTINNGKIHGRNYAFYLYDEDNVNERNINVKINGGEFTAENTEKGRALFFNYDTHMNIEINGGTFTGKYSLLYYSGVQSETPNIIVNNGIFNGDIVIEYDFSTNQNENYNSNIIFNNGKFSDDICVWAYDEENDENDENDDYYFSTNTKFIKNGYFAQKNDDYTWMNYVVDGFEASNKMKTTPAGYPYTVGHKIILNANYEGKEDSIIYTLNNGSMSELEDITRENYKFLGWNTKQDGTGNIITKNSNITANTTLYAQWELIPGAIETQVSNDEAINVIVNSEEISNAVLTEEEKEIINSGKNIKIEVIVEDITENISTEEKEKIAQAVKDKVIGAYIDISILKTVDGEETTAITNTENKVKFTINIPDELIDDDHPNRVFYIVRMHDGKVETLNSDYNAENHTLTFETDKFSTYALAYTDGDTASKPSDETTNPKTGDSIVKTFILFTVSLIGIVLIVKKMKH